MRCLFTLRLADQYTGRISCFLTHPSLCSPDPMPLTALYQQLDSWYDSPCGKICKATARGFLQRNLADLSGQVLIGLGLSPLWLETDPAPSLPHCYQLIPDLLPGNLVAGNVTVRVEADLLPIRSNSVSVVVMHHALELSNNPHHLLREVERILVDDGHVIIIGFNPRSPLGLASHIPRWRSATPPATSKIALPRLKDWLSLLGLEPCHQQSALFRVPLGNIHLAPGFNWFDRWCEALFPTLGNLYIIKARKRRIPLTLIGSRWSMPRPVTAGGTLKPTTRNTSAPGP